MTDLHRRILARPARLLALLLVLLAGPVPAATDDGGSGNALQSVDYSVLPGNRVEIRFQFAQPVSEPRSFTIRDPARIALDFANTRNATGERRIPLGVGVTESVALVEAGGRTRAVLNLSEVPRHSTRVEGSAVVLAIGGGAVGSRSAGGFGAAAVGSCDADSPGGGAAASSAFR